MAKQSMPQVAPARNTPADQSNQSLSDAMWAIVESSKKDAATDRRLAELARASMRQS